MFVAAEQDVGSTTPAAPEGLSGVQLRSGNAAKRAYEEVLALPSTAPTPAVARPHAAKPKRRQIRPPADTQTTLAREAFMAVECNDQRRIGMLVRQGLALTAARDSYGWTLLMSACAQGNAAMTRFLLALETVDCEWTVAVDTSGRSARDIAGQQGHVSVVQLLDEFVGAAERGAAAMQLLMQCDAELAADKSEEIEPDPGPGGSSDSAEMAASVGGFCAICQAERLGTEAVHAHSIPHLVACQHFVSHRQFVLGEANKGFQIMKQFGWAEAGLGPLEKGRLLPVKTVLRTDRRGVGAAASTTFKSRVSHYAPHDDTAVQNVPRLPATNTKKDLVAKLERERRQEQRFRAYFSSPDF